jgi:hypothetical protein
LDIFSTSSGFKPLYDNKNQGIALAAISGEFNESGLLKTSTPVNLEIAAY